MAGSSSAPDAYSGVDALVARFKLTADQGLRLRRYATVLSEDARAPTTVREPQRVIDDHLADSLVALTLPAVRAAKRVLDIGAGAGLPGVVLAVALPTAHVTLLEGSVRKCDFLSSTVSALDLTNVQVAHTRVESWDAGLGEMDVVTARALAPLAVVCEYAAPPLRLGGTLVAWRGRRDPEAERAALVACDILGLVAEQPLQVHPYVAAKHRHLHVMTKVRETPAGFPRRPGMAVKRPLA